MSGPVRSTREPSASLGIVMKSLLKENAIPMRQFGETAKAMALDLEMEMVRLMSLSHALVDCTWGQ